MRTIGYKRHFQLLIPAAIVLLLGIRFLDKIPAGDARFFSYFALLGVLHALSLVLSLRRGIAMTLRVAFVALALAFYGLYRLIMRPALSTPGGENRRGPERTSGKEPGWGILYDAADRVNQALLKLQPEEKKEQPDRTKPTSRVIS